MTVYQCQCGRLLREASPPEPVPGSLDDLTDTQRRVVQRVLDGETFSQIALELGVHPSAIQATYQRATIKLLGVRS